MVLTARSPFKLTSIQSWLLTTGQCSAFIHLPLARFRGRRPFWRVHASRWVHYGVMMLYPGPPGHGEDTIGWFKECQSSGWSSRDLARPIKLALDSRVLTVRTTLSTDGHSCILGAMATFRERIVSQSGVFNFRWWFQSECRAWRIGGLHHRPTKSCPRFTWCKLVRCTITSPLDLSIGRINSAKVGLP